MHTLSPSLNNFFILKWNLIFSNIVILNHFLPFPKAFIDLSCFFAFEMEQLKLELSKTFNFLRSRDS